MNRERDSVNRWVKYDPKLPIRGNRIFDYLIYLLQKEFKSPEFERTVVCIENSRGKTLGAESGPGRMEDFRGKLLGQSGLIRPGEEFTVTFTPMGEYSELNNSGKCSFYIFQYILVVRTH